MMNEYRVLSRRALLTGAVTTGAGVVAATILPPFVTGAQADLIPRPSVNDQKKLGQEAANKILSQYKEVNDDRARRFKSMGERLVAALPEKDRKTWDFNFRVLDSKDVNAFALPGGPMFMYTGLYELLNSEDALAAVTGHEMTHVRQEHWAKAYQKQQQREIGITALGILLRANRTQLNIAGLVDNVISLKYSRGEEDEADAGGLKNMVDANYNPQGMIDLFQALQKKSGNGGSVGGDFLSDHPLTSSRINKAKERITAYGNEHQFPALKPLS